MAKKRSKKMDEKVAPEESLEAEVVEAVEEMVEPPEHAWVAEGKALCAARNVQRAGTKITMRMLHTDEEQAAKSMDDLLRAGILTLDEPS